MKNDVLLIQDTIDKNDGGPSKTFCEHIIARYLVEQKIDIIFFYQNKSDIFDSTLAPYGQGITNFINRLTIFQCLFIWKRSGLFFENYQKYHVNGFWSPIVLFCIFLVPTDKLIIQPKGMLSKYSFQNRKTLLKSIIFLVVSWKLRNVVCTSEQERLELPNWKNKSKCNIYIVPYYIKVMRHDIIDVKSSNIVYVGRISKKKRPLELARLLDDLDIICDFFGPVDVQEPYGVAFLSYFEGKTRHRYLGTVVHSNIANEVFRAGSILLLPTFQENFGNVILEALASGVPVITTPQSSWAGFGEKGLFSMDWSEWESNLTEVIQEVRRDYLVYSNRAVQFASEFSIQVYNEKWDRVYESI
jgi:glycosyltransferase involved in cell wall biosynthesis